MSNESRAAQLSKQHPVQIRQVNNFILRHRGVNPDLVKGKGYFYFASLIDRPQTSVYVNAVGQI